MNEIPQDKLGVQIGLDETVASARISRYETGEQEPPYQTSLHLAKALHIPVAYLYCDDDDLADILLKLNVAPTDRIKVVKAALG